MKRKTQKSVKKQSKKSVNKEVKIFLWSLAGVVVLAVAGALTYYFTVGGHNQARLDRINAIYASLNLGDSYQETRSDVFGEKRPYEWDKGRSYSSVKEYDHDAGLTETAKELKSKIEAAGFKFFDEPYPGTPEVQYHFKSAKGEYIRLTVSSKAIDSILYNPKDKTTNVYEKWRQVDTTKGPSHVVIKVNLDDNNE